MAWADVIDQEKVITTLRSALASGRVAHAYLFHGADGVGKKAVALEFAQALLCEAGNDEACGSCAACRKSTRGLHADLHVLLPQPKEFPPEEETRRLELLYADRYAAVDFARRPFLDDPDKTSNKQAGYHIERVNESLRRAMSFKPVEGRYKIAVIADADLFNKRSANAFLKLLEEPGPQTVFILTTSRTDHVLPTILSRCQRVRFALLPHDEIARRLVEWKEVAPDQAAIVARMADGSFSRAVELAGNHDLIAMRQAVVVLFRQVWTARTFHAGTLDKLTDVALETGGFGRERVKGFLRLILSWLRDIVLYRESGSPDNLVNADQEEAVAKFAVGVPEADVESMIGLTEEALALVQRNVNLSLLLMNLFIEFRRAMRGEKSAGLYRPLVESGEGVPTAEIIA